MPFIKVLGGEVEESRLEPQAGVAGGHAVEVRAAGGGGGGGVGHLVGAGGGDAHRLHVQRKFPGHHLADLGMQPLAHLGAAVVDLHAAVGIDMEQGAGLVEVLGGEGDAELHRGQRQAALDHGAARIEVADRLSPCPVVAARLQPLDQLMEQAELLHGLAIVGDVPPLAVEIALAHREWVLSHPAGDVVHGRLDHHHPLGAAEAAEGGVGGGMGAGAMAGDQGRPERIGVVGVEHGAVDDGIRQVRRVAAVADHGDLTALDHAALVHGQPVAVMEGVALAGGPHVLTPGQAQPGGAAGAPGHQGGDAGPG